MGEGTTGPVYVLAAVPDVFNNREPWRTQRAYSLCMAFVIFSWNGHRRAARNQWDANLEARGFTIRGDHGLTAGGGHPKKSPELPNCVKGHGEEKKIRTPGSF